MTINLLCWAAALSILATSAGAQNAAPKPQSTETFVVKEGDLVAPRVVAPCRPGSCPFAGQTVTVIVTRSAVSFSVMEVKDEFEAATGAKLDIVRVPPDGDHFATLMSDVTNGIGKYDASIAAAWWLGELVTGDYIISYDKYYDDPRFPKWNIDDVLPGPRSLLLYGGKKYMVANSHNGQVIYYRRDLFADPQHQSAFKQKYGYELDVPKTWKEFRDIAEYFDGRDLNGDGEHGHGLTMALKPGSQAMFNYMSVSAPFVIGPDNPKLYWFDPETMKPLLESPGHVRALKVMVDLFRFGSREMLTWQHGKGWGDFLSGHAALAITWHDLGALAQQEGSKVKGKIGVAPIPGTHEYYDIARGAWAETAEVNHVGNTNGGSWAGVISKFSKAPEATYYLLALMATKDKSRTYVARGWDATGPGRTFHFLPPDGDGVVDEYVKTGWDLDDLRQFSTAFFATFEDTQQFPYLRIPGAFNYWLALDLHLGEAMSGQLSPEAALRATAVDFEEITIRLGRERQRQAYRESLGF
jgi:multiple sugar transport system substrate-binding protein